MNIVGLISGTSADAIDAALCAIDGTPPHLEARIVTALTVPYPDGVLVKTRQRSAPCNFCKINSSSVSITTWRRR